MAATEGQGANGSSKEATPIRVWCDGCFDAAHYGHANQLRQASLLGDVLVAGVHRDAEIAANKGPPVFTEQERYRLIAAVKVEVVEAAPLQTQLSTLDEFNCDFCVHGDDLSLFADGTDTFAEVKAQKRYREVARTPGISTTDLVGRMVLLSTDHHLKPGPKDQQYQVRSQLPNLIPRPSVFVSDLVQLFSSHEKPTPGQEVVYVAGAFDFFHIGHLCFLEKVAKEGRFVLVGVHSDAVVNGLRGQNFPVMSLYERVLGVLANRYVHQVLIGPDYSLSEEFIAKHRIDRVIHGRSIVRPDPATGRDPYEVPKGLGIFETVDSGSEIFTDDIFQRIIDRRLQYIKRNEKKAAKEENAYAKLKAQSKTTMDA